MKNDPSIRLKTLLRLYHDQLGPDQRRRVEVKVQEDSEARARWQQLQKEISAPTVRSLEAGILESSNQNELIEQIAGWFDGTLSVDETIAFENQCWESRELLHDVNELFQSSLSQPPIGAAEKQGSLPFGKDQKRRERLVNLFPTSTLAVPRINGAIAPLDSATLPSPDVFDFVDESNAGRSQVVVPRRSANRPIGATRFSNPQTIAIAIVASVAMILSSIIVIQWALTSAVPDVVVESPKQSESLDDSEVAPSVVETNRLGSRDENPVSNRPEEIVDLQSPNKSQENGELELPDEMVPAPVERRDSDGLAEMDVPTKSLPPATLEKSQDMTLAGPTKLAWSWEQVEGLVAVRSNNLDVWAGALAKRYPNSDDKNEPTFESVDVRKFQSMECKVLPLSWAQASLEGLGVWTIPENTDFLVTAIAARSADRPSPAGSSAGSVTVPIVGAQVNLRSGRMAIANANANSVVNVETTTGNWRIQITDAESIVIVEQSPSSRLIVQKGAVRVNGMALKARQQLVRARDGRLETSSNRETTKWIKKPENKFPSRPLADQWMASQDLFTDLSQLNSISQQDQPIVRAALATIDPPGQAAKYLANVLPEVRAEGIRWMLAYGRDPQQLRTLADQLATEMNVPGLETTLPRLVMAIHRKRWPAQADTESLIAGMQNRNPSVRRLSHGLLVHLFGSLEDYDPESEAVIRSLQARKWAAAINRLYRRLDNARRR